jgi:hypothetical protein
VVELGGLKLCDKDAIVSNESPINYKFHQVVSGAAPGIPAPDDAVVGDEVSVSPPGRHFGAGTCRELGVGRGRDCRQNQHAFVGQSRQKHNDLIELKSIPLFANILVLLNPRTPLGSASNINDLR